MVVALVVLVALAPGAGAHASLQSTEPIADTVIDEPPARVVLRFDETVTAELGSGLRVFGPDGGRVDRGQVERSQEGSVLTMAVEDGGRGTYTVAWRVVSSDSHVLIGSFLFHVGERTGAAVLAEAPGGWSTAALAWLARWAVLVGAAVVGGAAALRLVIDDRSGLTGRRIGLVVGGAAVALVLGSALRLVLQVAEASGRTPPDALALVADAVRSTRAGRLDLARLAASLTVAAATAAWPRRWAPAAVLVGTTVVAVANAFGGHAWTSDGRPFALVADIVHQAAVAIWVGGLVVLAVIDTRRRPQSSDGSQSPDGSDRADRPDDRRRSEGSDLAPRFSVLALGAAMAVAVSGTVSGWQQVGELSALASTTYGRLLVAKVVVFAAMLGLGWWNRATLARLAGRLSARRSALRLETVLAVAALGLTAALVAQVPGRELVARPYAATVADGAGTVSVTVEPAATGSNALHLYFFDDEGRPRPVDVAEARVAIGDVPARRIDLQPITVGHFSAPAFDLPTPGRWHLTITAVTRGVPTQLDVEVPIR